MFKKIFKPYNEANRIKNILSDYIYNNGLCTVLKDSDGNPYVERSVLIEYVNYGGLQFYLQFVDRADKYSARLDKLENLGALFDFPLMSVDRSSNKVLYTFGYELEKEPYNFNDVIDPDKRSIILDDGVSWKLGFPNNVLITGLSGSGKTYLTNNIILQCLAMIDNYEVVKSYVSPYFIDAKNADVAMIGRRVEERGGLDNRVGTSPNQIDKILRLVDEEMDKRYSELFGADAPSSNFGKTAIELGYSPITLFIDEWAAFSATCDDKKTFKSANAHLTNLILKGRQAGICVFLIAQRPDSSLFDTPAIRDSFQVRIMMGQFTRALSDMVFGSGYSDLPQPEKKGQGYIQIEGIIPTPVLFSAPYQADTVDFMQELDFYF